MPWLRKHATALVAGTAGSDILRVSLRVAGETTYAASADWTPAAGEVKVSKDGGAELNIATLPTYSNGSWRFELSAGEMTAKMVRIRVSAAAVDDWDDTVESFGAALAMYPDNYAALLIGAPAGVSLSADVAAIKTDTVAALAAVDTEVAAIKADTAATLTAVGTVPTAIQNADALFARALPASPTTGTAGEALTAAAAQGMGDWDLTGDVLTLKRPDGTTLAQFDVAPAGGPYVSRARQ